jgi:HD-GYP domain-containing protein (c-di-GMP phosphodiesterase class II)
LLHDIGKLSVPDEILKKPGSLDQDEFEVIKRHPEWGHKLLGELGGFPDLVRRLVLDHHERLDGAGYPNGRTALELDLETRILTVCDVYDALLSVRVYRDAWTHAKAIGLLHEQTGTAFDPGCVAALERVLARDALVLGVAV